MTQSPHAEALEQEAQVEPRWENPYGTLSRLCESIKRPYPKNGHWRLAEYRLCHVNALPNSHGRLVATDGILCWIITERGLFEGHFAHLVYEDESEPRRHGARVGALGKAKKTSVMVEEYDAL